MHKLFAKSAHSAQTRMRLWASMLLCLLLVVVFCGLWMGGNGVTADFASARQAPSLRHWFGTDWLGRDIFTRTMQGLSLSLTVGAAASVISALVAVVVGMAAATGSKRLDTCVNWLIDLVMGVPHLILIILISFACGRGLPGLLAGIAATHWTGLARLIRAEVLQLRTQPYITASRRLGKHSGWILAHHILPHMVPQFTVGLVLMFPHAILHEASVSFLGFGLPPEQPAIGILLSESLPYLSAGIWWPAVFPGLMLVCVVLLLDRLGDALKVAFDPYAL